MAIAKPTGEYADEMLDSGGWVETDEQSLYDRAQRYTQVLQQTTKALEGFQHERGEIFDGGVFEGDAADAAKSKLDEVVQQLTKLQQHMVSAITWYQYAGDTVAKTKSTIADRVHSTQQQISRLENESDSESDDQADAIGSLVNEAHNENIKDVVSAAANLPATESWKPAVNALQKLLDQKSPPAPSAKLGQSPLTGPQQLNGSGTAPASGSLTHPGEVPPPNAGRPSTASGALPHTPQSGKADNGSSADSSAAAVSSANPLAQMGTSGGPASSPVRSGAPAPAPSPANPLAAGAPTAGPANAPVAPGAPGPAPSLATPLSGAGGDVAKGPAPAGPSTPAAPTAPLAALGVNPSDVMGQASGGLAAMGTLGGGSGGDGHGGVSMGSALSNALGGQSGGQQNPLSTNMFEHHAEPQGAGLQQAANQAAMNNAASAAASSATSAAVGAPLAGAAQMAPAAAHGPTAADVSAAVAAGGGAVSGGGQTGGGVASVSMSSAESSASSMPLLPPATPHAAAPVSSGGGGGSGSTAPGSGGPGVHPASTSSGGRGGFGGSVTSSQAEAAPAPIPVSSARAQKDAIADATRRGSGGGDVQVAYRLAAALNAPDMVNKTDFNFVWMTAVTTDGQIVIANSYGLAFIPAGVCLPAQVIMASADGAVPVQERARWATYPNLALQGWAAHHNTTLRMVIAKREQFAGIDPGVPTRYVADEDIPVSGKMQGRSRLEVVAPAEAARLVSASDLGLLEMLPPAPVDASPPADQRSTLWFDVIKPVMRSDVERGLQHLQSFTTYAAHAQELALHRAHSAVHAVEQRDAVADWLYWQHLTALLDEALAGAAR